MSNNRLFAPALIAILCLVFACVPARGEPAFHGEQGWESVVEIIDQVAKAAELPVGLGFRQEIVLKALFSTWKFHATVVLEPDGFSSVFSGAPGFVPDTLAQDLIELGRSPSLFELKLVKAGDGGPIVLKGPRRSYHGTGPREATFWVDPRRWVIDRAEAAYSWGTLSVTQEYTERDGVRLLSRQRARVSPYGFTLDVAYLDYQFP